MLRLIGLIRRIFRREDIVTISQSSEAWEAQYKKGSWDRLVDSQPNTERIARLVEESKAQYVLDVGCGNGGVAKALLPFPDNMRYVGIDISETAIARAIQVAPDAHWIVGDIVHRPENVHDVDIIIFNEVLYYVDIAKVLQVYTPVIKKDGVVIISIIRSWRTPFLWRRIRHFVTLIESKKIQSGDMSWDVAVGRFK
jgi:SAM-dependent methyltransferase